jgi:hypothetical protein
MKKPITVKKERIFYKGLPMCRTFGPPTALLPSVGITLLSGLPQAFAPRREFL